MALLRDAAIIHTDSDGRQTVHLLNAPLRDWRPSRRQRVYQFESEDGTITTRAVGGARWDAEVRVRFDALPTSLMETLALGVTDGLLYVPSLSAGVPGYEMQVVGYDDRIALDPDEARWAFGEYEVTFAIRRPADETLEGLIDSGPWLYLHTAGDGRLTTSREDPAPYVDYLGVGRLAAAGVLRTTWRDGRPYTLVEASEGDRVSTDWTHAPQSMAVVEAGIEAGFGGAPDSCAWQVGAGTDGSERMFEVYHKDEDHETRLRLGNSTGAVEVAVSLVPSGAEYQRLALLEIEGADAQVRLIQRYRTTPGSGAWSVDDSEWQGPLDATDLIEHGWEQPVLTLADGYDTGRETTLMLSTFGVLRGSDWTFDSVSRLSQVRQILGRGR